MAQRPVFGIDRDPGVPVVEKNRDGSFKTNPLLVVFGPGPEGAKCGDCSHLFLRGGGARDYYKCDLRRVTGGPGSDHRVRWPACGRYAPEATDSDQPGAATPGRPAPGSAP